MEKSHEIRQENNHIFTIDFVSPHCVLNSFLLMDGHNLWPSLFPIHNLTYDNIRLLQNKHVKWLIQGRRADHSNGRIRIGPILLGC